jgi:AbrB family looped-hinge helix DNA binding protein
MEELRTNVDNTGRLLIPAIIRKQMGIKPGDAFLIKLIDDEIKIVSLSKAIAEAQNLVKQFVPEGISLVDELKKTRNEEFKLEQRGKND